MNNTCSFCGLTLSVRKKIIVSSAASICDRCVALFHRNLVKEGFDLTLQDEPTSGMSSFGNQNQISDVRTINLKPSSGPTPAILVNLNIPDPHNAHIFIQEVAEKFKLQRICSPPDTSVLLVTMVSDMPASRFVERWHQLGTTDKVLSSIMSEMREAAVFRNNSSGQPLERISLIPEGSS